MSDRPVFLYAAVYDEIADAEADYEAVFDLHALGAIGTFRLGCDQLGGGRLGTGDQDREAYAALRGDLAPASELSYDP